MSVEVSTPEELWMLWRVATEDYDAGWVSTIDEVSGMECFLAFPWKEIAMGCASDYRVRRDIECHPVRVHPAP